MHILLKSFHLQHLHCCGLCVFFFFFDNGKMKQNEYFPFYLGLAVVHGFSLPLQNSIVVTKQRFFFQADVKNLTQQKSI